MIKNGQKTLNVCRKMGVLRVVFIKLKKTYAHTRYAMFQFCIQNRFEIIKNNTQIMFAAFSSSVLLVDLQCKL